MNNNGRLGGGEIAARYIFGLGKSKLLEKITYSGRSHRL
jgi:hypothetical protein